MIDKRQGMKGKQRKTKSKCHGCKGNPKYHLYMGLSMNGFDDEKPDECKLHLDMAQQLGADNGVYYSQMALLLSLELWVYIRNYKDAEKYCLKALSMDKEYYGVNGPYG